MACEEHLQLASFIKSVHRELRDAVQCGQEGGAVWAEHLARAELLARYAAAMRQLATSHWAPDTEEGSRVRWVHNQIQQYFHAGGRQHEHSRDVKFARRRGVTLEVATPTACGNRVKLLDVGSCYNPFSQFEDLEVLALDIAPALPTVIKCDFLNVKTSTSTVLTEASIVSLERHSFNVVVFCLVLEYLPTASQRYECVRKSAELLSEDGLLCIVTPDSSHQAKNLEQLKSWRRGLNLLGLRQVTYTKTRHFHGLVFRRPSEEVRDLTIADTRERGGAEAGAGDNLAEMFFIPQDFASREPSTAASEGDSLPELDRDCIKNDFLELPSLEF